MGMNAVFTAGPFVLRVARPSAPGEAALALHETLRSFGVPVTRPARADVVTVGDVVVTCWERVVTVAEAVDWREVGDIVRRVHSIAPDALPVDYPLASPRDLPWWDFETLLADTADLVDAPARAGIDDALERRAGWRAVGGGRADHVVCHGDVHPGNVVMSADGPVLMDWDLLSSAPAGWDHAPTDDVDRTLGRSSRDLRGVRGRLRPELPGRPDRRGVRRTAVVGGDADAAARRPIRSRRHGSRPSAVSPTGAGRLGRRPGPPSERRGRLRVGDVGRTGGKTLGMSVHPIELSTRLIDSGALDTPPNRVTQELSELADGVALIESFSHVLVVDSGDGLIAFDSSGAQSGAAVVESLRTWSDEPVHTIVYTHGHADHVGGSRAFASAARERG